MNRKRRFDDTDATSEAKSVTVPSISGFSSTLQPLNESLLLATAFEVYSVYCSFLREGYLVEVETCQDRFYFLSMTKGNESKTVVPIGANCHQFCLQLLNDIAEVDSPIFVAWVSYDGTFTVYKVFQGIHRPEEKPKTGRE